jgi:hypothetical protein
VQTGPGYTPGTSEHVSLTITSSLITTKCCFLSMHGLVNCSYLFVISSEKEHGVHFDEIVKRFKLPERKIM